MSDAERQRLLADAILLERASRVLERRVKGHILTDPILHAGVNYLIMYAAQWRREAEHGDT